MNSINISLTVKNIKTPYWPQTFEQYIQRTLWGNMMYDWKINPCWFDFKQGIPGLDQWQGKKMP